MAIKKSAKELIAHLETNINLKEEARFLIKKLFSEEHAKAVDDMDTKNSKVFITQCKKYIGTLFEEMVIENALKDQVYLPREDSDLIKAYIKDYAKGKVLDMGTGSGILALEAYKYTKDVYGVDINPVAVNECKENYKSEKIKFLISDLFTAKEIAKLKFDLILFNPPYLPFDPEIQHSLYSKALIGGKKGYETILKFITQLNNFLKNDGKCLLVFSSLSKKEVVDEAIEKNMLQKKKLDEKSLFYEKLYLYLIEKSPIRNEIEKVGVTNLEYFAKGCRGLIFTGQKSKFKVTCKIKHYKSKAENRMENEARWLKRLNKENIGPKYVTHGKNFVIYKFIEGIFLEDYVYKSNKKNIYEVLKSLLEQCYILDKIKVNKEEMHYPVKNMIISKDKPILIDFERMHSTDKPKNVTQFCQFLVSNRFHKLLFDKGFEFGKRELLELAKSYKKGYSKKILTKMVNVIKN
jgi:release factor glutamine methyltransferase